MRSTGAEYRLIFGKIERKWAERCSKTRKKKVWKKLHLPGFKSYVKSRKRQYECRLILKKTRWIERKEAWTIKKQT